MSKNTVYTIRHHIPDGKGGYRNPEDLSKEELDMFREINAKAVAESLIESFRKNPTFFDYCRKMGYVTGLKRR